MSKPDGQSEHSNGHRLATAAGVIVVSSVMFTFISAWRTAAIVLCDLGSTSYYIGGIVEQSVGKAAPWFIIAVMLFSYAVRSVYIESCSMYPSLTARRENTRSSTSRVVLKSVSTPPRTWSSRALRRIRLCGSVHFSDTSDLPPRSRRRATL